MPHNIVAIKTALVSIVGSTGSIVLSATTAIAITEQLNIAQPFMHLLIPTWLGYAIVILLALIGAIASQFTDTIQQSAMGRIKNFFMGFLLGVVGAFVILPNLTSKAPAMELMFITSLSFAFSGVVLLHNLSFLLHSNELKKGMMNTAIQVGGVVKDRIIKTIKVFFGMDDKGGDS